MYVKNQLQLVFQQFWTGLLKDWLQLVATSSVASCLVLRNLAISPVASCLTFGQKDWTGLDFKTLFTAPSGADADADDPQPVPTTVNDGHYVQ